MEEINNIIRNFVFYPLDLLKLQELESKFQQKIPELHFQPITIFKDRRSIYRCRPNNPPYNSYFFESAISYNPNLQSIKTLERCNELYSSKFYGSISTDEVDGEITCVAETSLKYRNDIDGNENNIDGFERFTVGKWNLKKDLTLLAIIPDKKNKEKELSKINKELIDAFDKLNSNYKFTESQIEFFKLLGNEFTKNVKTGNENEYAISAMFSELALNYKGIAFPSTKTKCQGFNIVINPDKVSEYLELDKVVIGDLYKFKKELRFNIFKIARLKNGIPFVWEDITEPKERPLNIYQIIEYFKNKGIEEKYIIEKLREQVLMSTNNNLF